jgi:hypothetical protein
LVALGKKECRQLSLATTLLVIRLGHCYAARNRGQRDLRVF